MARRYETTVVGFIYSGGIVIGADSQLTRLVFDEQDREIGREPLPGDYLKIRVLNERVIVGSAGRFNDTNTYVHRWLVNENRDYNGIMPPSQAARILCDSLILARLYRNSTYVHAAIGGYEPDVNSGELVPRLFLVDDESVEEKQKLAVGTGERYASAILDDCYKFNMRRAVAKNLAEKALAAAAAKDPITGGKAVSPEAQATGGTRIVCRELTERTLDQLEYLYAPDQDFQ